MNKNKDKEMLLIQAKQLKALGQDDLAQELQKRARSLGKKSRKKTEAVTEENPEVVMTFEDGRVIFKTPDPGYLRRKAFGYKVREAGLGTHKYDPKTKSWSFKAAPEIISKVKQAIGDFFSEAKLVDANGRGLGRLPKSTYQAEKSSA